MSKPRVQYKKRALKAEADLATALERVKELEWCNRVNQDETTQLYQEVGVPECPKHGGYCSPHVLGLLQKGLEAIAKVAQLEDQVRVLREAARVYKLGVLEVHSEWDKDRDTRVGKLLACLGGLMSGYRDDLETARDILTATEPKEEKAV
jgi:hypothetical protein